MAAPFYTILGLADDAMDCVRQSHPKAGAHHSTAQAVSNLKARIPHLGGKGVIVGHGKPGVVITDNVNNNTMFLAHYSHEAWVGDTNRLSGIAKSVRLLACQVGAEAEGALLLWMIAQSIKAPVSGPTGIVYCQKGKFVYEKGSVWQTARPGAEPKPISAAFADAGSGMDRLGITLTGPGGTIVVSIEEISAVEIRLQDLDGTPIRPVMLDARLARPFLQLVDFGHPFAPGSPLALVTGELTMHYQPSHGAAATRTFKIYNDCLLRDVTFPSTFYRASRQFASECARVRGTPKRDR